MEEFIGCLKEALEKGSFVKLTLSKTYKKDADLKNVYIRLIELKGEQTLSFLYRYQTNDQTKNYAFSEAYELLNKLLVEDFRIGTLITKEGNVICQMNKKRKAAIRKEATSHVAEPSLAHDKPKVKRPTDRPYLFHLGVTNENGEVIPKMADKYRQISKYIEVLSGLIKEQELPSPLHVVDMGSGKGYLTFALYEYLTKDLGLLVNILGVELRSELVDSCNAIAEKCGFEGLKFESAYIQDVNPDKIDILIALHACDTATDDALYKGIMSKAKLIVCAPCCHKQIRQQLKGQSFENPILKYGIFKERQFEMVTDTIRSLVLEQHQYKTKVFEFVSNEHTRKNILLVGTKGEVASEKAPDKIAAIKSEYGIQSHYLEELFKG